MTDEIGVYRVENNSSRTRYENKKYLNFLINYIRQVI